MNLDEFLVDCDEFDAANKKFFDKWGKECIALGHHGSYFHLCEGTFNELVTHLGLAVITEHTRGCIHFTANDGVREYVACILTKAPEEGGEDNRVND
jgi:hypothetical protein